MNLVLFGAGGHSRVVVDCAELLGYNITVCDDNADILLRPLMRGQHIIKSAQDIAVDNAESNFFHITVGDIKSAKDIAVDNAESNSFHIAVGDNEIRAKLYSQHAEKSPKNMFPSLVHPNSCVSRYSMLGDATFVAAGAVVEANSNVGIGCILNTNSVVNHDCQIDDFVHVAPGATLCGNVCVGQKTLIGANATVLPKVTIGKNCIVGAGSVVLTDIPDNTTVVGNPSKTIGRK